MGARSTSPISKKKYAVQRVFFRAPNPVRQASIPIMKLLRQPTVLALLVGVVVTSGPAAATELRDMLFAAIQHGEQSEVLSGEIAERIAGTTGSREPIEATVTPVGNFAGRECRRLRIAIRQHGVKTVPGALVRVNLPPFELNMCLNGQPPAETQTSKALQQQSDRLRANVRAIDSAGKIQR